ncbi:DUF2971 domain-containing protein [Pseudomonas monteilii]|uniref:DUF2971 domain-containing protein n=1 Tax=Pseudomonas monteilii TaxID=76759 RepID=UPI003805C94B
MRVYHFLNKKYGLESLEKRRLKISTFDSVNDPFELLCHELGDAELRGLMSAFKKTVSAGQGMICFSKSMHSPVQWAHYADRHKGICLGFDIPEKYLAPVKYVSERLDYEIDRPWSESGVDVRAEDCFLTKYDHWSYEEEMRMFGALGNPDTRTGLYFQDYDEHMRLAEIIVGCASGVKKAI